MKLKTILSTLIIGFGLINLVSSYSTHYEFEIPETFILNNSAINSFNNLNFSSEYNGQAMQHVLYIPTGYTPNGFNINFGYFVYYDGKPYLYSSYVFDGNVNSKFEGFVQNICVKSVDDFVVSDNVDCDDWTTNVSAFLNATDFVGGVLYYGNSQSLSSYDPFVYCFRNSENYYCMGAGAYSNSYNYSQLSGSLEVGYLPDDVNRISWSSSPFTISSFPEGAYLDNDYNNQDVMLSWSRLGYTKNLCYSDFSISRLFDMSGNVSQIFDNDLEDGMGYGTGATVFDLYSGSSVSNFASFWSSSINRVNSMFMTNIISNYWSGRPVGQAYLSYKLNERLEGNSNFNLIDYYQFCQFALGLSDSQRDLNYTGSKLPSDVESQLETEKHIRICSMSGAGSSAFCGGFSAGGGAGGGGSRPASISDFYNSAFSILEARDGLNLTGDGILPYYISLGFIAFLLLYLLKR